MVNYTHSIYYDKAYFEFSVLSKISNIAIFKELKRIKHKLKDIVDEVQYNLVSANIHLGFIFIKQ